MTTTAPRGVRGPSTVSRGLGADLVTVGCAGLLIAVAAVVGVWLLDQGVPLHVDAPPLGAQWLPHTGPGTVPAVVIALLVVLRGPQLAARLPWRGLLVASAAASVAWTLCLALIDGWQAGVVDRLTTPTEYLREVPRVTDIGATLRTFTEHIQGLRPGSWTARVAGHPPGALLVFLGVAVAVTLRALSAEATARAALPFGVLFPGRDLGGGVRGRPVHRGAELGDRAARPRRCPSPARSAGAGRVRRWGCAARVHPVPVLWFGAGRVAPARRRDRRSPRRPAAGGRCRRGRGGGRLRRCGFLVARRVPAGADPVLPAR